MKLILDTHAFLWWLDDPHLLSSEAQHLIRDGKNHIYISAAVIWEIMIKKRLGKLKAPDDIAGAIQTNRFFQLPVTINHAMTLQHLPDYHRDPFDRILIAQAQFEGFTFISRDAHVPEYDVSYIMA